MEMDPDSDVFVHLFFIAVNGVLTVLAALQFSLVLPLLIIHVIFAIFFETLTLNNSKQWIHSHHFCLACRITVVFVQGHRITTAN